MKKILFSLLAAAAVCTAAASINLSNPAQRNAEAEKVRQKLVAAKTAADSIPILYDIFDLCDRATQRQTAPEIYRLARRSGNDDVALDALRLLSGIYTTNDSALLLIGKEMATFPQSPAQRESVVFNKWQQFNREIRRMSESERITLLEDLLSNPPGGKADLYDRVYHMACVSDLIGESARGELYTKYLEQLRQLVSQLPQDINALRNNLLVLGAIAFTDNDMPQQAIEADEALLRTLDEMQANYDKKGRHYRHYDTFRYMAYRRMLRNYQALPAHRIENIYSNVLRLVESDADVAQSFEEQPLAQAYYLIATHRNAEAIPYLKTALKTSGLSPRLRYTMARDLRHAAISTGDAAAISEATSIYADELEHFLDAKTNERNKEIEMISGVEELRANNARLTIENQETRITASRKIIIIVITVGALLIVVAMILFNIYSKSQRLARNLRASNEELRAHTEELEKTRARLAAACEEARQANKIKDSFVAGMSQDINTPLNAIMDLSTLVADNVEEAPTHDMGAYAKLIRRRADTLLALVHDVMDISTVYHGEYTPHTEPTTAEALAMTAIGNVRPFISPNVSLVFNAAEHPDVPVITDVEKCVRVLTHLLDNAVKFTSRGKVDVEFEVNTDAGTLTFYVTDTGIGIPPARTAHLFDAFEKLNTWSRGEGIGLYLAKLVSEVLGGDVKFDATHTPGARFAFTIPLVFQGKSC